MVGWECSGWCWVGVPKLVRAISLDRSASPGRRAGHDLLQKLVTDSWASCRWAVGVLVYEMVAGYPPFYDEDRVAMFRNICQVKYTVPSHFSKVDPCSVPLERTGHPSC